MRLKVDEKNDAIFFRLDESVIVESEEVAPGIILDFNKKGQVVGVEFLGLKDRVSSAQLKTLQFEST